VTDNQAVAADTTQQRVTEIVDELVSALVNARIYYSDHPRVHRALETISNLVRQLCREQDSNALRFTVVGDYLAFRNRPLVSASLAATRLIQPLSAWRCGGFDFGVRAHKDEYRLFVEALLCKPDETTDYRFINEWLQQLGGEHIALLPPFRAGGNLTSQTGTSGTGLGGDDPYASGLGGGQGTGDGTGGLRGSGGTGGAYNIESVAVQLPVRVYQSVMGMLQDVTVTVCQGGTIDFDPVRDRVEQALKMLDRAEAPLLQLANAQQYDAFTLGHSARVAMLSINFARRLTQDSELLVRIGAAALLHDVGKSMVPFEVLHARRALSPEEREAINLHPTLGAQLLLDHAKADAMGVACAFGHHKKLDAAGYPQTLHHHHLSTVTRIVKIADVYEALTAARPYKAPMSPGRAYRIMLGMQGHFDLALLHRFIRVCGVFANGSEVTLSTGERAVVVRQSNDLLGPVVKTATDHEGNPIDAKDARVLDLSSPQHAGVVRIVPSTHGGANGAGAAAAREHRPDAASGAPSAAETAGPIGCCGTAGDSTPDAARP
jgi:HD-GYP domain-containing protein (c-di-GMP phosphodiesterase class II)